jgi:uncharacterized protein (DUF1778 family)
VFYKGGAMSEEIIQFVVTAEEKALIEEMAKSDDRTVSDYVHHTVILRKAWQEFKKLGE